MRIKLIKIATLCLLSLSILALQPETLSGCPTYVLPCPSQEANVSEKTTILTFYIQKKVEQQENYIEMSLTIKEKDSSLKKAIQYANKKVAAVSKVCDDYCNKNKEENCQDRVIVDNYKVEPSYQVVRREPIFNGFVVTNDVKIIVVQTEKVGQLVDLLLGVGIYQFDELQWKPFVEIDSVQKAIDAGISKAKQLCGHINRKIGAILSITEILEEEEDDENEQSQQVNNEENEQQQPAVLKFQVQCINKTAQDIEQEIRSEQNLKKKKKKK